MKKLQKFISPVFAIISLSLLISIGGCTKSDLPPKDIVTDSVKVADQVAPTVASTTPGAGATAVALNINPSISFSEPMNLSTVTNSTIQLKQGSTTVAGNVSISGNNAVFTPSAALSPATVYTITISTGVKDAAGNSLASVYSASFTTQAQTGKSFSVDVAPILNKCNTCHTHGWTPSSNASSFYSNLVSKGYVNTTTTTSGKIYQKVNGGHPSGTSTVSTQEKNTVITWILEGSKNN
jgi:hypothetical protein